MSTPPSVQPFSFQDITSGALTSLAAQSSFNEHVTCNPQVSHFAGQSFKRHTHFTMAHVFLPVDKKPSPTYVWPDNHVVSATVGRNRIGDLLGSVLFQTRYNRASYQDALVHPQDIQVGAVNHMALAQILECRLQLGDQILEKHSGDALFIMDQLAWQGSGIHTNIMHGTYSTALGGLSDVIPVVVADQQPNNLPDEARVRASEETEYTADLHFHMGNGEDADDAIRGYFPLVAMQYHQMKLEVSLRKKVGLLKVIDKTGAAPGVAETEAQIVTNVLNPTHTNGAFELLNMQFCLQTVFLSPEERTARAQVAENRIVRYIDNISSQRVQANDSEIEFKLETENNTAAYMWYFARDARLVDSAKDYFDFSVQSNDGLMPFDLNNAAGTFIYWPRHPIERTIIRNNNNVLIDATGHHLHHPSAYLARYNRLPNQFIYSYNFATNPHKYNEHSGSQADTRIDSVVMRILLARNNDAGTGINRAGTLHVIAHKWSNVLIQKGQVGILYATH